MFYCVVEATQNCEMLRAVLHTEAEAKAISEKIFMDEKNPFVHVRSSKWFGPPEDVLAKLVGVSAQRGEGWCCICGAPMRKVGRDYGVTCTCR